MSGRGRCVVITGVSRGLGRALAAELIRLGHEVHGCARSMEAVQVLAKAYGEPHSFSAVDVAEDSAVKAWAESLQHRGVTPDLLINNAAIINRNAELWTLSAAEFGEVMDVNVKGLVNVLRHWLPVMVGRRSGVVVNISSGWGRSVDKDVVPYCASKWAVEGLSQGLAEELPAGMCCAAVNPGIIDTDMLRQCFGEGAGEYPSPGKWAKRAAPFLLGLSSRDNGIPQTVPA